MNNIIFSTPTESFSINSIIYVGSVIEIPIDKRKNDHTHSFKMITVMGAVHCYFKNADSAKKARNLLGLMMDQNKKSLYKFSGEIFDTNRIVSFGKILTYKKPERGYTHAIIITIETMSEKTSQVWMSFKTEEFAKKARKALYAAFQSLRDVSDEDAVPFSKRTN